MRSVHIQQTVERVRCTDDAAAAAAVHARHTGPHIMMAVRYANVAVERRIHADGQLARDGRYRGRGILATGIVRMVITTIITATVVRVVVEGGGGGGARVRARLSVLGGELHSLLFLPLVAEPHAHHVLLQVQLLGDGRNLFARWPRLHRKVRFERTLLRRCDGSPFS